MSYWSHKGMTPNPVVKNTWNTLLNGGTTTVDTRIDFFQILNLDNATTANVCIGIQAKTNTMLANITNTAIAKGTGYPTTGTLTTIYDYFVTSVNSLGKETAPSNVVEITDGSATLSAITYHTITWSAVTGASKYRVYCRVGGSTSSVIKVAEVTTNAYNDTGAMSSTNNIPWVNLTAIDSILSWSALSPGVGMDVLSRPLVLPKDDMLVLYTTGNISYYMSGE